jgi:site-specific recombinase XerD
MPDQVFRRASVRARIFGNSFGSILRRYVDHLVARGHRTGATHQYVFAAEHFGRWLGPRQVDHKSVEQFIRRHLPRCRCRKPAARNINCVRAALYRLLEMLEIERPRPAEAPLVAGLLRGYEQHLRQVCGLAGSTIHYRLRYARALLRRFRVHRARDISAWSPARIAGYIAASGRRWKPSSGQVAASSARSFLRFLLLHRLVRGDLATAVPSFANWRLSSVPVFVGPAEMERLVVAADIRTSVGMRDRAVILCMTELGLRAAEVAALDKDGVDLAAGVLRLRRPKERATAELPMTGRLLEAIRLYLRRGRPRCSTPSLFVIHRAPLGGRLNVGFAPEAAGVAGDRGLDRRRSS